MTTIFTNAKTVYEKYCQGVYNFGVRFPGYAGEPSPGRHLRKYLKDPVGMTPNQIREGERQKAELEAAKTVYQVKLAAYEKAVTTAQAAFRRDLEIECGMVDHTRADAVWKALLDIEEYIPSEDAIETYKILVSVVKD